MTVHRYTLEDYSNIIFSSFDYKLPETIECTLAKLKADLCITTVIDQVDDRSNKKNVLPKKIRSKRATMDEQSWEKIKAFQTTKIEKKEGIEKSINDVRICLNKLSNKNYEAQRDAIKDHINQIVLPKEEDDGDAAIDNSDELLKIANAIFDIASTNKFYSEIYATLCKDLIVDFPIFKEIVGGFIQQYTENVALIQYVDSNEDYDKYCENNKVNDKRKAMSAFIVNLMKNDILDKNVVVDVVIRLQELVIKYLDEPNRTNEVEEITENVYIFVTMSSKEFTNLEKWTIVIDNIKKCSQFKAKEHPSLSSRAIFKYMDILDFLSKK